MTPPSGEPPAAPSPFDLVRGAAEGDEASIDLLLERHLPALRAFIRSRAGPRVRARDATSDLVQSVCLQALEGADGLRARDEESFRSWLYTAALRLIYARNRFHRAQKRAVEAEAPGAAPAMDSSMAPAEPAAVGPTPSHAFAAREDLARVEAAFARLTDEQRDVILLARLGDLSHAEIAEQFGCTEEAARQRLWRALARLWMLARGDET